MPDSSTATLGYIVIGTENLSDAVDYYAGTVQLEVTERRVDAAFLRGGWKHHWVRLVRADRPGVIRVGYQATSVEAIRDVTKRLDDRKVSWEEGGDLAGERVEHYIRFRDPNGIEIELFDQMVDMPVGPRLGGVEFEKFLHTVWQVADVRESERFFREVLGFEPSDWIERRGVFMRCGDRYHHSLALLQGPAPGKFDHFCIQVKSIDDVMRGRNHAVRRGAQLRNDLLRHAPSGSMGIYLADPVHELAVEFCTGHPQIAEEDYRPRLLPLAAETLDVWLEQPPAPRGLEAALPRDAAIDELEPMLEKLGR
jgi:catechol 2,3-dioxygenase-like lactoylglutathione lyase family enzyme